MVTPNSLNLRVTCIFNFRDTLFCNLKLNYVNELHVLFIQFSLSIDANLK